VAPETFSLNRADFTMQFGGIRFLPNGKNFIANKKFININHSTRVLNRRNTNSAWRHLFPLRSTIDFPMSVQTSLLLW
jgi:hypothetical protein